MVKTSTKKTAAVELPNVHPADELFEIREEISQLEKRAVILREKLLKDGASLKGDMYTAVVKSQSRETLDRKALTEAFGEAAVAPFVKTTSFKAVSLVENTD